MDHKILSWNISTGKKVKLLPRTMRVLFQREMAKSMRGVSISPEAFAKMDDVSITPFMSLELEKDVVLKNDGDRIHLVKYCTTFDDKRCTGGQFFFTPNNWQVFWNEIYNQIDQQIKR